MTTYTYTGSPNDDILDLDGLVEASPKSKSFIINSQNGDDEFYAEGQANVTFNGGPGDDCANIMWLEGDSIIRIRGARGNDSVEIGDDFLDGENSFMLKQSKHPNFSRYKHGTVLRLKDPYMNGKATLYIEDSVELITFYDELGNESQYVTKDLASGKTKKYFGNAKTEIDWWYDEKTKSTTASTSTDVSRDNKINGTNGDDVIKGKRVWERIDGKGGDDLIDPGKYKEKKWVMDILRGGPGSDTFVIKEDYWAFIRDFDIIEDKLDLSGLSDPKFSVGKRYTDIYDGSVNRQNHVCQLKGAFDLSEANIV